MPKKSKTTKKNDIKQKQTQKQVVNVNINQPTKTKKRKSNENKKPKPPQTPIIYKYGEPSIGNPSNNLYYSRPPIIAQVIPAMGSETNTLMPPNNTNIENILQGIKDKTKKIMKPMKKLTETGTTEIFNIEPKKKLELKQEQLITAPRGGKFQIPKQPPFKLTGEIVQRKNTDMQTEAPKRRILSDSSTTTLYNQEPNIKTFSNVSTETPKRRPLSDVGTGILHIQEPNIKTFSSVATEANIKTPNFKQMIDASQKIKAAAKSKLYSNELKPAIEASNAVDKIGSAIKSKLYSDQLKKYLAVDTLGQVIKRKLDSDKLKQHQAANTLGQVFKTNRIRNKYLDKVDKKEKSKLHLLEAQTNYVENLLKKVDEKHKENETDKLIKKSIKNNAALNLQKVMRGHASRKDTRNDILKQATNENKAVTILQKVIRGHAGRKEAELLQKPTELFGGTRSGTIIHPEATAPPQPLFGKGIDKSINDNFSNFRKIYDTAPKSYEDVKEAKKQMNVYKQNINRIKKRNGKSILSEDQMKLKEEMLIEITKLQKTYDKIYKDFYKTQQPKKGRKPKA